VKKIQEIEFLTDDESLHVKKQVEFLKSYWRLRNEREQFNVLGASCYAEAQADFGYYQTLASFYNPLFQTHFSQLYTKLNKTLEFVTGLKIQKETGLNLPGFHIFQKNVNSNAPHVDAQYRFIPEFKDFSKLPDENVLTFTAAVNFSGNECGLNIWPEFEFEGYDKQDADVFLNYAKANTPEVVLYKKNYLYIHRGHLLHQIYPTQNIDANRTRITLQGHGIIKDNQLMIYF
jgi:hypothetical protein